MNYKQKIKYKPKPEFRERIEKLIGKEDAEKFFEISYIETPNSIRCNTLKISCDELKERLEKKGWKIGQPLEGYPEIMVVESEVGPGGMGNSIEHLLGYYYVQDISSMLPILALKPVAGELLLDLCASPGSKTTQAAAMMENKGTIIANDKVLGRIRILNSNLERCGVMNTIVTQMDGVRLCEKLEKAGMKFDKILVDAPCSGEGTLRKSIKTYESWSVQLVKNLSRIQKKLVASAIKILKVGGEMIYSTCTLSPEEDESVVDFLLKNFNVKVEKISLPLKLREGVCDWGDGFDKQVEKCCRLYPQDNNTDGFFLAKIRRVGEDQKQLRN